MKKKKELDETKVDQLSPQQQLFHYARSGNVEGIKALAKLQNFSADAVDDGSAKPGAYDSQNTALHYAAQYGHLPVAQLLDQLQANVDKPNKIGSTPLHVAASHGQVEIIKFLLRIKAKVQATNKIGNHPLHCSIYAGYIEATRLLIEGYDDPRSALQTQNFIGMAPLKYAAANEMKEFLKQYFPNPNANNNKNNQNTNTNTNAPSTSNQNQKDIEIQIEIQNQLQNPNNNNNNSNNNNNKNNNVEDVSEAVIAQIIEEETNV